MAMKSKILHAVIAWAKRQYRKDRDHFYVLKKPWTLPPLAFKLPAYRGRHIEINGNLITIKQGKFCDGATMAPDRIGEWSMIEASLFHDAAYGELEEIAAAWGWRVSEVRAWADWIFAAVGTRHAPSWMARVYFRGVRAFGGIAHFIGKAALVLVLAATIGGCGGCALPDPFEPGAPYTPPEYERVPR